jgi:hypothetical protein
MQARRTLTSGQKGVKNLFDRYSGHLVCARYHYDEHMTKPGKTLKSDELQRFSYG